MDSSIYRELGLKPIINAAGTLTCFGGSLMRRETIEAMERAATEFVDMAELLNRADRCISELLNVEAALVTGGAASGILLGTAAAISQRFPEYLLTSDTPEYAWEVMRQKTHRDLYDRHIVGCGAKIVEVESEDQLDAAISDRTVMMMAYNFYESSSTIKQDTWLKKSKQHGIPTLLDAAADVPPVKNLWEFCHRGFDMVAFSGGKAIRGPQSSGLLLGKRSLIDAARSNAMPNEGVVGRVAKVSKEDVVGLWIALKSFVEDGPNHGDRIGERCRRQLKVIEDLLAPLQFVRCQLVTPAIANHFPHLVIDWDRDKLPMDLAEVTFLLRDGDPAIATGRVFGIDEEGLVISAINLQDGEPEVVGKRLRELLDQAQAD